MKLKDFKDKISKGLGSPILFLKNNPEQAYKYSKVILWACCHDTRYDSQCESGRSAYLYAAICLSNRKSQLENDVLDRLLRTKIEMVSNCLTLLKLCMIRASHFAEPFCLCFGNEEGSA